MDLNYKENILTIRFPSNITRKDLHKLIFGINPPELDSPYCSCAIAEDGCNKCPHKDDINCDVNWWNEPLFKPKQPEEHSCFKRRHLGWECVGEGITPVCEQEPYVEDTFSGLHKSKPTVSDKNDCYWFDNKEK